MTDYTKLSDVELNARAICEAWLQAMEGEG